MQEEGVLDVVSMATRLSETYHEVMTDLFEDYRLLLEHQCRVDSEISQLLDLLGIPVVSCGYLLVQYFGSRVMTLGDFASAVTTQLHEIMERHGLTISIPPIELSGDPEMFSRN